MATRAHPFTGWKNDLEFFTRLRRERKESLALMGVPSRRRFDRLPVKLFSVRRDVTIGGTFVRWDTTGYSNHGAISFWRGAFNALARLRLIVDHDTDRILSGDVLADNRSCQFHVWENDDGAHFRTEVLDSLYTRQTINRIRSGELSEMSVGLVGPQESRCYRQRKVITKALVQEISIVGQGGMPGTHVRVAPVPTFWHGVCLKV